MTIIESIREFILPCPLLKDGCLNVDYLGDEPTQYSIEGSPVSAEIKRYSDGGALKQYNFIFSSKEFYGDDVLSNLENNGFYEQFAEWMKQQSKNKNFPKLDGKKSPVSIEALSNGCLMDGYTGQAKYQIQCGFIYYEEA